MHKYSKKLLTLPGREHRAPVLFPDSGKFDSGEQNEPFLFTDQEKVIFCEQKWGFLFTKFKIDGYAESEK